VTAARRREQRIMPEPYSKHKRADEPEAAWRAEPHPDRGMRIPVDDEAWLTVRRSGASHVTLVFTAYDEFGAAVLDRGRAEWLRDRLTRWLETGEVE